MADSFKIPWSNSDVDIHPDPPSEWSRVVVAGGWEDAAKTRKRWPHAAAVGPLRTVRGIDLLVRALLANPQVRVTAGAIALKVTRSGLITEVGAAVWLGREIERVWREE